MEANDAILPRITVAEEIVRRLRLDRSLWPADHFLRAEVDLIDCMLRAERSGVHYIDYLRAGLGEFDYDFDRYAAFLGHHKPNRRIRSRRQIAMENARNLRVAEALSQCANRRRPDAAG